MTRAMHSHPDQCNARYDGEGDAEAQEGKHTIENRENVGNR